MFGQTWQEDLIFIFAAATNLGFLLGVLRWIGWDVYPNWNLHEVLLRFYQAIKPSNALKDDIDMLVHLSTMDRKVRHFRAVIKLAMIFGMFWNFAVMDRVLAHDLSRGFSHAQATSMLVANSVIALGGCFPGLIKHNTLDIFYIVLVLANTGLVSPWAVHDTSGLGLAPIIGTNGLMVLLNFARRTVPGRRVPIFSVLNLVFYASSASSMYLHGDTLSTVPLMVALFQLLMGAGCCACLAVLETCSRNVLKEHMQLMEVKELSEASCTLLRSCCQVVVEMDGLGVITSDDADLSSFLLKGGGQRSLKGTALADLLVEEDRAPFLARLQEMKLQQTGLAENLPVSMRDGCGNVLRLSLLWLQFNRTEGQRCLVGIRELVETYEPPSTARGLIQGSEDPSPEASATLAPGQGGEATPASPRAIPDRPTRAVPGSSLAVQRQRSRKSSRSSWSSSRSSSLPEDAFAYAAHVSFDDTGALLVVDGSLPDFPVRLVSSGFRARAGQLPLNTPLASFTVGIASFKDWLQESLNFITYDLPSAGDCCVQLKFGRRHLKACCRIITFATGRTAAGAPLSMEYVGLFFFNFKRCGHSRLHASASGADAIVNL